MKLELSRVTVATPGAGHARRDWPERRSLLVRLERAQYRGVGEASPLPGYSPDTLPDVEAALSALSPSALERALSQEVAEEALDAISQLLPASLPAGRFALETAALDLLGHERGLPAPELLGAAPRAERSLALLLGKAADAALFERATAALRAGYTCLKLKLGAEGSLQRELAHVIELRRRIGPAVALRLDANGALTRAQLERACAALSGARVELFEEPGELPAALGSVPLALDESLQALEPTAVAARARATGASFVVLKPTALGGLRHCQRVAARAREVHAATIVSHCFDGPWAMRAAAALALALPAGPAQGLAPHAALASFPGVEAEPCVRGGALRGWSQPGLGISGGFD